MVAAPLIIGIGHQKGVGKDYLATVLCQRLRAAGIRTSVQPFAYHLKNHASMLFGQYGLKPPGWYEDAPGRKEEPIPGLNGMSARQVWLRLAQFARTVHPDIWVDKMFEYPCYSDVLITPDVRFPNEVEAIRDKGGLLVRVVGWNHKPVLDGADDQLLDFADWDYFVYNDFEPFTIRREADNLTKIIKEEFDVQMQDTD